MPYFVRYRLSRRLRRSHGKLAQSVQKLPRLAWQVLILQATRVLHFPRSSPRQPGQLFRLRRKAQQRLQFMPQGAIRAAGLSRRAMNFGRRVMAQAPAQARRAQSVRFGVEASSRRCLEPSSSPDEVLNHPAADEKPEPTAPRVAAAIIAIVFVRFIAS